MGANVSEQAIIRVRGLVNRFGSQTVHDGIDLDVTPRGDGGGRRLV